MKNKLTAQEMVDDANHYTSVGAKAMVKSGRGGWLLDPQSRHFRWSRLWRDPNSEASLGTDSSGKIYE